MKDKLRLTHLAHGGVPACAGLVPMTGAPGSVEPTAQKLGPALGGCTGTALGAGQVCGGASLSPLLDRTTRHGGTPLPSSEMLVGDGDLFRDVAKWHRSLAGSPCPSLAAEMPGGSSGQSILIET